MPNEQSSHVIHVLYCNICYVYSPVQSGPVIDRHPFIPIQSNILLGSQNHPFVSFRFNLFCVSYYFISFRCLSSPLVFSFRFVPQRVNVIVNINVHIRVHTIADCLSFFLACTQSCRLQLCSVSFDLVRFDSIRFGSLFFVFSLFFPKKRQPPYSFLGMPYMSFPTNQLLVGLPVLLIVLVLPPLLLLLLHFSGRSSFDSKGEHEYEYNTIRIQHDTIRYDTTRYITLHCECMNTHPQALAS